MKARVRRLLLVLAAAALLLDGGLLLAGRLGAASLPEEDTAYFLDVGEGDCTLLVSGGSTVTWMPVHRRAHRRSCAS